MGPKFRYGSPTVGLRVCPQHGSPVHAVLPCFFKTKLIYIPKDTLVFQAVPFVSGFTHINSINFSFHPLHATWPTYLIRFDFFIQIFYEEYGSWEHSLCIYIQSHVTFSLLCLNIFFGALITVSLKLKGKITFHTSIKQ